MRDQQQEQQPCQTTAPGSRLAHHVIFQLPAGHHRIGAKPQQRDPDWHLNRGDRFPVDLPRPDSALRDLVVRVPDLVAHIHIANAAQQPLVEPDDERVGSLREGFRRLRRSNRTTIGATTMIDDKDDNPALTNEIVQALLYGNLPDDTLEIIARSEGMTLAELKEDIECYRRKHRN
jgi:hypothetical protein